MVASCSRCITYSHKIILELCLITFEPLALGHMPISDSGEGSLPTRSRWSMSDSPSVTAVLLFSKGEGALSKQKQHPPYYHMGASKQLFGGKRWRGSHCLLLREKALALA